MREQIVASVERQRTLLRDPEYREAMQTQQKMLLMRSNPDVARISTLTADQVDRLFEALADQALRQMESANVLWERAARPGKAAGAAAQVPGAAGRQRSGAQERARRGEVPGMAGIPGDDRRALGGCAPAHFAGKCRRAAGPDSREAADESAAGTKQGWRCSSWSATPPPRTPSEQGFHVSGNNALQAVHELAWSRWRRASGSSAKRWHACSQRSSQGASKKNTTPTCRCNACSCGGRAQREAGVFDQVQSSDGSFVGQTVTVAPASD